eukprot:scaffold7241_cov156-Ochromonas_danica.AAC.5
MIKVIRSAIMWSRRAGTVVKTIQIRPTLPPLINLKNIKKTIRRTKKITLMETVKKILKMCQMNPCYPAMVNDGPPQKGSSTIP